MCALCDFPATEAVQAGRAVKEIGRGGDGKGAMRDVDACGGIPDGWKGGRGRGSCCR